MMNTCCVCGCTKYMGIKPGLHFQLPSEDRNLKWNTTNRAEGELAAYKLSKKCWWEALCDQLAGL